jgi:hypothetical protein
LAGLLVWLLAFGLAPSGARAEAVDLELVLAVDASGSVDETEFQLQIQGIAEAFRDEAVQSAVASGPQGRIAVALVVWADATQRPDESDWFVVGDGPSANAFADAVTQFPRRVEGGTGIGSAISFSVRLIGANRFTAPRRVVDVSGDGVETPAREDLTILLPQARATAAANDVVVNGLAIVNEVRELDDYYRTNVIIGHDSFVMKSKNYEDFRVAIRSKLLREISARIAGLEDRHRQLR